MIYIFVIMVIYRHDMIYHDNMLRRKTMNTNKAGGVGEGVTLLSLSVVIANLMFKLLIAFRF